MTLDQVQLLTVALAGLPDPAAAIAVRAACAELGLQRAAAPAAAAYP